MAVLRRPKGLAELLLEEGLISKDRLQKAVDESRRDGVSLQRVLVEGKYLKEPILMEALSRQTGIELMDLTEAQIDPTAAALIPTGLAQRYTAIPIGFDHGKLVVAMSDPANVFALDDIRTMTQKDVKPVLATSSDILSALGRLTRLERSVESLGEVIDEPDEESLDLSATGTEDAPIVRLVNMIITQAVNDRASDIHVEPREKEVKIRFRIDGVLHDVLSQPKRVQAGVISRLKVMAEMDIAERRLPQDGRIGLVVEKRPIDIRVASLPTVYGEKLVLRILDKSSVLIELEQLGFSDQNFTRFKRAFTKPYGMILVTGPTGSGKSTSLYATLSVLNQPDRNIITVEDPVEYRLAGVNQMQTHARAGLTFPSALRSILRADPDIILIGEIRDRETAQIAIEAALTGHMVLTTLHTNDAPSAVGRLIEMGIEPFLVASATDAILAQRLARKLCNKCKKPYKPTREALLENGFFIGPDEPVPKLFKPVGCQTCGKTGYLGRMALHELMEMTEEAERLTVERKSTDDLRTLAIEQGMIGLREDGLAKVRAGLTSIEEIQRVVR